MCQYLDVYGGLVYKFKIVSFCLFFFLSVKLLSFIAAVDFRTLSTQTGSSEGHAGKSASNLGSRET